MDRDILLYIEQMEQDLKEAGVDVGSFDSEEIEDIGEVYDED